MITITNLSMVTDNSGETPIVTYSNLVTTLITSPTQTTFVPRMAQCQSSNCRQNSCGCGCRCGCQRNCNNCCNN